MCSIDGCAAKAVAKGLCAKHYMRQRRHGDPGKVCKAGRPRSELSTRAEWVFPNASLSTRGRWKAAMKLLSGDPEAGEVVRRATRPNGSVNVSRLLEMAIVRYFTKEEVR
jgi:hypothetical protein